MLNPELKPYPIAVYGSQKERHGSVLAKNYGESHGGKHRRSDIASKIEMPRPCHSSLYDIVTPHIIQGKQCRKS